MVSVYPNPAQRFHYFDHMNASLPGLDSMPPPNTAPAASTSGNLMMPPNYHHNYKKIRKPYTITKSRESWTEQEHDKFLEALHLFDRDWKKIEAFVGSKTVIQIRSHAQKYFQKVQKNGTSEHVPAPRPKRKAAHPYPQKAPKQAAAVVSHATGLIQPASALQEPAFVVRPDSSSVLRTPASSSAISSWSFDAVPMVPVAQIKKDDEAATRLPILYNSCYSSSSESTPRTWPVGDSAGRGDQIKPQRGMPDFSKVYSFIGSVFDPEASGHLERLKQMDPVDLETALLLMRNLSLNLASPEFEDIRNMLSSYSSKNENPKLWRSFNNIHPVKTESAIPSL